MSRPEKESAKQRRASGVATGSGAAAAGCGAWLLSALACLPTEDLSSYSSGSRRGEPEVTQEGPAADAVEQPGAGGVATEPAPAGGGAAPPSAAPLATGECNGDCAQPELPLLLDAGSAAPAEEGAGGSVAPSTVPASSGDAGVAPAPADAAASGPCGQGALLAPDERCFALVTTVSTWTDAREVCGARGAGWDLAVIRSVERNSWLAGMLAGVTDAWVGANDLAQEGSWRWLGDTNPFFTGTGTAGSAAAGAYVNWNTGGTPEPNGGAASDCLRLRANGGWADIACTSTFAALCEGPLP